MQSAQDVIKGWKMEIQHSRAESRDGGKKLYYYIPPG